MRKLNNGLAISLSKRVTAELRECDCHSIECEMDTMYRVFVDWLEERIKRKKHTNYVRSVLNRQAKEIISQIRPIEATHHYKYWLQDVREHFIPFAAYIHEI